MWRGLIKFRHIDVLLKEIRFGGVAMDRMNDLEEQASISSV